MDTEARIFESLRLIEERIKERLTVEQLAKSAYFSKFYYQRVFRETVGESVMRYVSKRRITLAAKELADTDDSVLDIALRWGYDSHEGFSRSFRAYMGISPREYRRSYHNTFKESFLMCTKEKYPVLCDINKEIKTLMAQAEKTAAYIRSYPCKVESAQKFYTALWAGAADRAEALAENLGEMLKRTEKIIRPDGVSLRLTMLRGLEDAAAQASLTAFLAGLTMARAQPEHRDAYEELCEEYNSLAKAAESSAGKAALLMAELSELIFNDIRAEGQSLIKRAGDLSHSAAESIPDDLPYGYIKEALWGISCKLKTAKPEEISIRLLEDSLMALKIVQLSAGIDLLRAPKHRELFAGIEDISKALTDALEFFRDICGITSSGQENSCWDKSKSAVGLDECRVFFLKAELQKLGPHLDGQLYLTMRDAIEHGDIDALAVEAEKLGMLGGPILYICRHEFFR